MSNPLRFSLLLGGCLLGGCGASGKTQISQGSFSEGARGLRAYPVGSVPTSEPPTAPPSRIPGSTVEPIGPLIDGPERLEALTLGGLSAKAAVEIPTKHLSSELGLKLAAVFGPEGAALRLFEASLGPSELAVASVRLEMDRCYGIAAAEEGLEGLRVHVLAGPPWPPTVIAQSSLLLGAGSVAGTGGCLRSLDVRGFSVYLVLEGSGGSGKALVGLFEAHN
ncbi:MAG: hypothetical protein SFV15_23255 [Polyangiaceae bacterium]|nr:hypothetical protein [Polyangiaceae bacterium]